jgi:hypothetical protein
MRRCDAQVWHEAPSARRLSRSALSVLGIPGRSADASETRGMTDSDMDRAVSDHIKRNVIRYDGPGMQRAELAAPLLPSGRGRPNGRSQASYAIPG